MRPATPSMATVVVATAILALFGGILLHGALGLPSSETRPSVVGAPSDDDVQPGIHWRSAVVDLRADSMMLRVGDEVFTTEGVDVVVDSYDGNLRQWSLYPRWVEDGKSFWMYLSFRSDGHAWEVSPWVWREGVMGPGDQEYEWAVEHDYVDDFEPENAHLEFSGPLIRMPLGEAFEGDWRLESRIFVPECGAAKAQPVDVSLTFENLRLTVSPREPTFLDDLAYDWFHRGSMLGDIFKGRIDPPSSSLLDCPTSD